VGEDRKLYKRLASSNPAYKLFQPGVPEAGLWEVSTIKGERQRRKIPTDNGP
jgi:hypothetical protein